MNAKKKLKVTKEGLKKLKDELKERKTKVKKRLQDELEAEMRAGDLSENASYYRVQDEIGSNDRRIEELEEMIKNAEIVESDNDGTVGMGDEVTVKVGSTKKTFEVVSAPEADPTNNKISIDSPLGAALEGKKIGDSVQVKTPAGKQKYDIIEVK